MPVGSRCVYWVSRMHARTSPRAPFVARARVARTRPHVVPYRRDTGAHTHARVIWIRTHTYKGGASTPPCQPPVVAVETKTEIRTSERARENGKDERKAMSNGREKRTKKKRVECTGNRGAGSRAIVELVSRPIHKRLLSVLPKISLLFFFFCLFLSVARLSVFADAMLGRNAC